MHKPWFDPGVSDDAAIADLRERCRKLRYGVFIRSETKGDEHLCVRCRLIDFEAIFTVDCNMIPDRGMRVFEMEIWPETTKFSCALCRMVVAMIFDDDKDYWDHPSKPIYYKRTFGLWALPSRAVLDMATESRSHHADQSIFLGLSEGDLNSGAEMNDSYNRSMLIERGFIQSVSSVPALGQESSGLPLSLYSWSKDQMKRCLGECRQYHNGCSSSAMAFPKDIMVIDCSSRMIVPLDPDGRYLALSYVWGDTSQQQLSTITRLPETLPRTIKDAMEVTLALGIQYLWVDRYCISQESHSVRQNQIGQMANIYSWAFATICALGQNDNAGIYGVSQPYKRFYMTTQKLKIRIDGPVTPDSRGALCLVDQGWTLQELVLSSRCLFFTEEGVMMACDAGTFTEHNVHDSSSYRFEKHVHKENFLFQKRTLIDRSSSSVTRDFYLLRNEYLSRRLKYESDAQNAFSAILAQLDAPSYWGIVVFRGENLNKWSGKTALDQGTRIGFLCGLCWATEHAEAGVSRCPDELPSWSWLTQTSSVENRCHPSYKIKRFYIPEIYIIEANHDRVELADFFSTAGAGPIMQQHSRFLDIRSVLGRWKLYSGTKARFSWTSNDRWIDCIRYITGAISYDNQLSSAQATDYPDNGLALLILVTDPNYGFNFKWIWLIVEQVEDGTYRRKGLIESDLYAFKDEMRSLLVPSEESLNTIRLG